VIYLVDTNILLRILHRTDPRHAMSGTPYRDEQRLALAVTRFIEEVHCRLPHARLEPMMPYEDEDAVANPA
jgi:hypothetical protein